MGNANIFHCTILCYIFTIGSTETWKNSQTKEKYAFCCHLSDHKPWHCFTVDSAAEEYNAFFYSLVSSVSFNLYAVAGIIPFM